MVFFKKFFVAINVNLLTYVFVNTYICFSCSTNGFEINMFFVLNKKVTREKL